MTTNRVVVTGKTIPEALTNLANIYAPEPIPVVTEPDYCQDCDKFTAHVIKPGPR